MMNGWSGGDWGAGAWVAMTLMMLLFWGGLATAIILLLRSKQPSPRTDSSEPARSDAERILSERFARGEIDEAEFTARRDVLRRSQ